MGTLAYCFMNTLNLDILFCSHAVFHLLYTVVGMIVILDAAPVSLLNESVVSQRGKVNDLMTCS